MTKQGVLDVLEILTVTYPNYHPDAERIMRVWDSILRPYDDETVKKAVESYIITDVSGFAPVIGQIVSIIYSQGIDTMTELEAWGYVSKALRNSSYCSEEEFARLPETVQRTVGSPDRLREWSILDESEVQTVVASNFMRSYRARESKRSIMDKLPESDRVMIETRQECPSERF